MKEKLKVTVFKTKIQILTEKSDKMPSNVSMKSTRAERNWWGNIRNPDKRNSKRSRKSKLNTRHRKTWDNRLQLLERHLNEYWESA